MRLKKKPKIIYCSQVRHAHLNAYYIKFGNKKIDAKYVYEQKQAQI